MRIKLLTFILVAYGLLAFSQINPTPQNLPYSENFSGLIGTNTDYPPGWQGGLIVTAEPNTSGRTGAAGSDVSLRPSGNNTTTSGGMYDFKGKIGFLSTAYLDYCLLLALNTTSIAEPKQVLVKFDMTTMLNSYDGTDNNYIMGVVFQYRIGTTGNFSLLPSTYQAPEASNLAIPNTIGQNLQSFSLTLPVECSNQPTVEVRWVIKRVTPVSQSLGKGQRQSFAIDNVSAEGTAIVKATYYVDADDGNDSSDGLSSENAWKTLTKVNETTLLAGSKILFKAGCIWTGQLWPKGSGVSENPIIIDQYGSGPKPIINGDGIINGGAVKLYNQSFWEINNLEITNNASTEAERRGIEVIGNNGGLLEHIYLRNIIVHDVKGTVGNDINDKKSAGIYFTVENDNTTDTRYDDIRIEGCQIYNCQNQGIVTSHEITVADYPGTPDWERRKITNLLIRNNTIHHISKNAMIIRLADGGLVERNLCYETATGTTGNTIFSRSSRNTVFQYNEGYLNRSPDYDGSMYDPDLNSPGTIWQYSYSHDNAHGLFWVCTALQDTGVVCRYNISQNDKGSLVFMNFEFTDVQVYNNTFYVGAGLSPTILHENGGRDHTYTYHNNIVYNANTDTNPINAKFSLATTGVGTQNRTITNNIFYKTNKPTTINFVTTNSTADPLLINPGSATFGLNSVGGYKLKPGSPAIETGKVITNNGGKDYFGIAVSSTSIPNIGFYNGPATTVAEVDPNFHIYLLVGQSNMLGSAPLEENIDVYSPKIKMMREDFGWVQAQHPISYLPNAKVGLGIGFANEILKNADPSVKIGLINTSVGGQAISVFAPGVINDRTGLSIYDESINRVNIARTQGVLKGILFHQGESNSGNNYASWPTKVKELINNFRTDFNTPQLPFIIGELGHYRASSPNINNLLPQLAADIPATAIVSAQGLVDYGDGIHFDGASVSELGVRYATALKGVFQTLPVELSGFKAIEKSNSALLTWKTMSESNNSHFNIERSEDGKTFSIVGKVKGEGNSTSISNYAFTDKTPGDGVNYYRLQQVDLNGKITYSEIEALTFSSLDKGDNFSIILYPNPADEHIYITLKSDTNNAVNINIYDLQGKKLSALNFKNSDGIKQNVNNLQKGIYILQASDAVTNKILGKAKFLKN